MGVIYVVHMNILFWFLYSVRYSLQLQSVTVVIESPWYANFNVQVLVRPVMGLFSSDFNKKFIMVEKPTGKLLVVLCVFWQ